MPAFTQAEIKQRIADGSLAAIAVDTNIFDRYNCNLSFPVLLRLDQFAGGGISVLFSEIVLKEVRSHITRQAAETQRVLNKALKEQGKRWSVDRASMIAAPAYRTDDDPQALADEQIDQYVAAVAGVLVPALGINDRTAEILERYFSGSLPFENREAKKNEFPDAFALLSLEAHARREGNFILCVSNDKGWVNYAENSDKLICMTDLEPALALFNEAGKLLADQTVTAMQAGNAAARSSVESAIEYRLSYVDFHATGWSSVEFDTEPLAASLQHVYWETISSPVVIVADDHSVTFTVTVSAQISYEASFSFSLRDSVDRDYVSLGSEQVDKEQLTDLDLVVTVYREEDPDFEQLEIEAARRNLEINFGTVEPYQSEDPYHEKY